MGYLGVGENLTPGPKWVTGAKRVLLVKKHTSRFTEDKKKWGGRDTPRIDGKESS